MQAVFSVFLLVLLGLQICQGFLWFNKHLRDDYDKLDKYLGETVDSDEIEPNMEKLNEWLAETQIPGPFKKADQSMSKAIKQILALRDVAKPEKCNRDGFLLLRANDRATRKAARVQGAKPSRRIDAIVQHYANDHRDLCWPLYPDLLENAFKKVSEQSLQYIRELTTNDLASGISLLQSEKIYVTLKKLTEKDPDHTFLYRVSTGKGHLAANKEKLKELFKKYIYNPCVELNEKVGKDYLEVILYDAYMLDDNDEKHGNDEKYKDYLFNTECLNTCRRVIDEKQEIKRLLFWQVETAA